MSESLQIAHNAVVAKLVGASRETMLEVQSALSYAVQGADHSAAYQSGHWDGRSTFFDWQGATFPAGFVHRIEHKLRTLGHNVGIVRRPLPAPLGPENPRINDFEDDPRYGYQPETVARLLKHGQLIAQVATGGGKSNIANLAVARIRRRCLFLTTRGVLMHQMARSFKEALIHRLRSGERGMPSLKVGELGDGEWTPSDYINVGMVQTFMSRLESKKPGVRQETVNLLASFELVILEEAHESGGNGFYEVMKQCRSAAYRLALTATPFMRDDEEANMRLMGCAGPVGIKVGEKMLIDAGILARPYFKTIPTIYKPDKEAIAGISDGKDGRISTILGRTSPWARAYKLGIVHNEWRNSRIVMECVRAARLKLPVMCLVGHKAHGNNLTRMLREAGLTASFIFGEHGQDQRRAALNGLRDGKIQVLIGSTILDVGVDVPAVGLVVLAGGGKAEVALRQRIGRGLRAKKTGPNVALIVDFADEFNSHLQAHAIQRRAIIAETPGFAEQQLPLGADFDLPAMGLA